MARYPLIHGNTHSRYDLNDANGDSRCISDGVFDVYKFKNSGATDNAERATMVVVLKNLAVSGTDTNLAITNIQLLMPDDDEPYEVNGTGSGVDVSLDGLGSTGSANGVPFMGSPEDFLTGNNNKILSKHGDVPGDTSADNTAGIHDKLFCYKVYDPRETVEKDDILTDNDSSEDHIAMPISKVSTLVSASNAGFGIPTQSYAAFTVHFHPQQDIPSFITICDLFINTNAGSYTYPLKVNSFNEIIMVAQPGLADWGQSQFNLNILNQNILDGSFIELGYHPKLQNIDGYSEVDIQNFMQDSWNYDGIKICDVSPNDIGNGLYKWKDSEVGATLTGDGETISAPANHSHAPNTQWNEIDVYWTGDGIIGSEDVALHGTDSSAAYYMESGRYPLYQYFESAGIWDGTSTDGAAGNTNGIHQIEGAFKRYKCFGVQWLANDYNNTNAMQQDPFGYDLTDAEPTNNQWFLYGIKYGVYQKITFDSAYVGTQTGNAYALRNLIQEMTYNYGNGDHAPVLDVDDVDQNTEGISGVSVNGDIPQTNRTWSFNFPVRWNNWNGSTSQTIEGQYSLPSFNWQGGTNYVNFTGDKVADVRASHYSEDGGVNYNTGGQFSHFSFGASDNVNYRDAWFRVPFNFSLGPDNLYSNCRWYGTGSSNELNAVTSGTGAKSCSLTPRTNDGLWNRDGLYPGLDPNADVQFHASFYPRESFIKILPITNKWFYKDAAGTDGGVDSHITPGHYPDGTGLPENINAATNTVSLVSNINPDGYWYGPAGDRLYNDTTQFDTNNTNTENISGLKMYSGNGGTVYENSDIKETIRTTATAAVHNANRKFIKDKNQNFRKEFIPYNKILEFPAPSKHSSSGKYTSFFSFRPFNEGDYPIWIHSVEVLNCEDGDGKGQMLDFCNKTFTQTNCTYNGSTITLSNNTNALSAGIRVGMSVSSTTNASNFSSGQFITEINGSVLTLNAVPDATTGSGSETCTFEFRTIHGTKRYGYKPNHSDTDAADTSHDPIMRYMVNDLTYGGRIPNWRYSNSYNNHNISLCPVTSDSSQDGSWPHALNVANPADWYRGKSSDYPNAEILGQTNSPYQGGLYLPPKMCLTINPGIDEEECFVTDERLDAGNIPSSQIDYWYNVGTNENGHDYPEYIGAPDGYNPEANPVINLEFRVAAKNTTVDFGEYYSTLKIRYYKDGYWDRNKIAYGGSPTSNSVNEDFRLHEAVFICKMNVQPTPVLAIHDTEGHNHTLNDTISMGNVNLG